MQYMERRNLLKFTLQHEAKWNGGTNKRKNNIIYQIELLASRATLSRPFENLRYPWRETIDELNILLTKNFSFKTCCETILK